MKSHRKKTPHVPGQYLGYSLQATRFLMHLLDSPHDCTVSLEVFEDVGVEADQETRIAEQDKSALEGNPVADRSVDLWKTFGNWVDAAQSGELKPETTRYVLYVSHPKTGEIVESFAQARSEREAHSAFSKARKKLWGVSPRFSLRSRLAASVAPYVERVFEADKKLICSIIQNFQFESGSGSPHEDLKTRFSRNLIPAEIKDAALRYALGWVKEKTDRLLEEKKPAQISVESYQAAMIGFIRKHDNRTILCSFAASPTEKQITKDLNARIYVRQLDIIEAKDDQKIRAVTDYLRASADRTQWSAKGLVFESSFDEFEEMLHRTWENHWAKINIALANHDDIEKGQYLFSECSLHQAKLEGLEVPSHFTPGSFHALSDELIIGWHPNFSSELGSVDEDEDM